MEQTCSLERTNLSITPNHNVQCWPSHLHRASLCLFNVTSYWVQEAVGSERFGPDLQEYHAFTSVICIRSYRKAQKNVIFYKKRIGHSQHEQVRQWIALKQIRQASLKANSGETILTLSSVHKFMFYCLYLSCRWASRSQISNMCDDIYPENTTRRFLYSWVLKYIEVMRFCIMLITHGFEKWE